MKLISPNYETCLEHVRALSEHREQRTIKTIPVIKPHAGRTPRVFRAWDGKEDWIQYQNAGLQLTELANRRAAVACGRVFNGGTQGIRPSIPQKPVVGQS